MVASNFPSKIRCKLQILLQMLLEDLYAPNLETEWKKTLLKRQERKPTHLYVHLYIIWKADLLWNGWPKLYHNVKSYHENPKVAFSLSWSETFQEVEVKLQRKFTGGTLTWYCYLDAWKPEASWNSEESEEFLSALIKEGLWARFWFQLGLGSRNSPCILRPPLNDFDELLRRSQVSWGQMPCPLTFSFIFTINPCFLTEISLRRLTILYYFKSESPLAQKV